MRKQNFSLKKSFEKVICKMAAISSWVYCVKEALEALLNFLSPIISLHLSQIYQGAVSIRKTVLLGMAIPMLKIRRPLGRLIFNMGIAIPGKTVFLIETAPRIQIKQTIELGHTNHKMRMGWI